MAKQRNSKDILSDQQQIVTEMLKQKGEARERIVNEIEKLGRELEEAKGKINESVISGNEDAFKQWSDQRSFCELRIQYLQEQLKLLPNKIASESESNDFARSVILKARKVDADNTAKAKELLNELQLLMDDSTELRDCVNNMLNAWSSRIGDITIARACSGAFFDSDLVNLKYTIEGRPVYTKIRDGVTKV